MTILRLKRGIPAGPAIAGAADSSVTVRAVALPPAAADRAALARFAGECDRGAGLPSRGTLAALATRPGRTVRCWVAHRPESSDAFLGVVALAITGTGSGCRPSISWLLVHPRGRRQGIGTTLVITAIDHARSLGALEIAAETRADWPTVGFWTAAGFRAHGPAPAPLV